MNIENRSVIPMFKRIAFFASVIVLCAGSIFYHFQSLPSSTATEAELTRIGKTFSETVSGALLHSDVSVSTGLRTPITEKEATETIRDALKQVRTIGPLKTTSLYVGQTSKRVDIHYYQRARDGHWLERFESELVSRRAASSNTKSAVSPATKLVMIRRADGMWALGANAAVKCVIPTFNTGYRPSPDSLDAGDMGNKMSATKEPIQVGGRPCMRIICPFSKEIQEAGRREIGKMLTAASTVTSGVRADERAIDDLAPAVREIIVDDEYGLIVFDRVSTTSGKVLSQTHVNKIERISSLDPSLFMIPDSYQLLFPTTQDEYSRILKRIIKTEPFRKSSVNR